MRITQLPLEYEMASKISLTWPADWMGTSTGCELRSESRPRPIDCSLVRNCDHTFHSGYRWSMARHPTQVAKPSLSHSCDHHSMVTRLPNHWCASSWPTTYPMLCLALVGVLPSSNSMRLARYTTSPQFSIAPALKSGTAIMSILGNGYALSKYSPKKLSDPTAVSSAKRPCSLLPTGVQQRTVTPSGVVSSMWSNSPTQKASRYVDITGVVSNVTVFLPSAASFTTAFSGMLLSATRSSGTVSVIPNVALSAGSSQHGKHRRASVGSNCVTARYRVSPLPSGAGYAER
mmetsp:Transcript_7850/g.12366  ORF Transcript_7850/g.12366 Transcript_7850/m.12366 type:complete len:289 (-) Transcript_7850:637-1503(-)